MIRAAGVLCVAPSGHVLLVHRTDGQGWAFPGGHIEDGESAEDAARRELKEETDYDAPEKKPLRYWMRRIKDEVDFTTFLVETPKEFLPTLNEEHNDFRWVDRNVAVDTMELHPGARTALLLYELDELGIAKAIREGELISPHRYGNLWVVALRITGTGAAYRLKSETYVWRDPSLYLNEEFLQRCNGLPVIIIHPDDPILDGADLRERVAGTIMLPYILDQEVWGVARIYDERLGKLMDEGETPLTTSPGVLVSGSKYRLSDGSVLLIEGKPVLFDHLAIVEDGVWDKGGEPSGVLNQLTEVSKMPDDNVAPVAAQPTGGPAADGGSDGKLDKILGHLDSLHTKHDAMGTSLGELHSKHDALCSRVDALEGKGTAPPTIAAVPPQLDAQPPASEAQPGKEAEAVALAKEREENKLAINDSNKRISDLTARLAAMDSRIPVQIPEEARQRYVAAQMSAERVAQAFGDSQAPNPLLGETLDQYRHRLLIKYKPLSPLWKDIKIEGFAGDQLTPIETQVYADALREAKSPTRFVPGQLRMQLEPDETGRQVRTFHGDVEACWGPFKFPSRAVTGWKTKFE